MSEQRKNSPVVIAIAVGLFTGLGFSAIGPRLWHEIEHSHGLTIGVIAAGFVLGFTVTLLSMRKKS